MSQILREDANKGNKLLQTEGKKNNKNGFCILKLLPSYIVLLNANYNSIIVNFLFSYITYCYCFNFLNIKS